MIDAKRFWSYVDMSGECWQWTGSVSNKGYGRYSRLYAHRTTYELCVGPIPEGLQLDHLCRNRLCCNPAHLEPVTNHENTKRGLLPQMYGAHHRAKNHCPQGHPYDEENTYRVRGTGWRACKSCSRARSLAYQRRKRLAA